MGAKNASTVTVLFHSKENFSSLALHEEHVDEKGKTLGITMRTKGDINFVGENINIGVIEDVSKTVKINSDQGIDLVCAMSSLIVDATDGAHFKAPKVKLYPEIEFEEVIGMIIMAENVDEGTGKKKGSGKGGKLTVDEIKDEFAKAAGYKDFVDLEKAAKNATRRLKGPNRWKYKWGAMKYGGPTDCAGLFTAIANELNQNYEGRYSTDNIKNGKKHKNGKHYTPYDFKEIPKGKNGKPDFSKIPEGAILWKPGHVGLYVGDGREISAKTAEGGEHTSSAAETDPKPYITKYTHWSYVPFVDYSEPKVELKPETESKPKAGANSKNSPEH